MYFEEGVIEKLDGDAAVVRSKRYGVCESCPDRDGCGIFEQPKELTITVQHPINAQVGEHVKYAVDSFALLKLSFLLYVFPILCLLAGALVGNLVAAKRALDPSLWAFGIGVVFFATAFIILKIVDRRLALKSHYQPKIVKVLSSPTLSLNCHEKPS